MAEFKTVCKLADIPDNDGKTVVVEGRPIAVFKSEGSLYALDDMCPHQGAPLVGGAVEDGVVTCPWHAWRFNLCDGSWLSSPRVKIPCYQVRVDGDDVQVEIPTSSPETNVP
jgi:nitrite reductase (NADH) small subunit/3-phenylpropionate/trans-cinnamate dioxygenase ferredoxin subunit